MTIPNFDPAALEESIRKGLSAALIREEIPWEDGETAPLVLWVNGPLHVQGTDGQTVQIRGVGTSAHEEPHTIRINGPVHVVVPRTAHVDLETVAGPVHVGGLEGGQVRWGKINGPLKVSATQICVGENVGGPANFKNIGERIEVASIHGPVLVTPCPPLVQLAQVHGPVRVHCPDPAGKRLVIHSTRSVVVKVPAETEVQGTIRSTGQVQVDLKQNENASHQEAEVRLHAAHPERALTVEITAGKQVYIGPNPPEISESAIGWELLEKLLNLFGAKGGRGEASAASEAAPRAAAAGADDELRQARQRILRLLAEGKISLEDAERLLDALEP